MASKIVVVAPTFNEEDNIAAFIEAVSKYKVKILISDSHSTDKTADIVRKYKQVVYLDVVKRGLGLGLSKGIEHAFEKLRADIVITMEADLSNDVEKLPEFISLATKNDLVIGSRYAKGGGIQNWSWWRKLLSMCGNLMLRVLSGNLKYHEFTNLYRAFNKKTWQFIKNDVSQINDWLFVPAFVLQAVDKPIKIVELPYIFLDRAGGRSKMNTVAYTMDLFKYAIVQRIEKSASFFKFLVVGGLGFVINTSVFELGVWLGYPAWMSVAVGAAFAITSNFIWNNLWTFSEHKITKFQELIFKYIQFATLSMGSLIIQTACSWLGEFVIGSRSYYIPIVKFGGLFDILTWHRVFYVVGVGLGLIWNYMMYSRVIWKKNK